MDFFYRGKHRMVLACIFAYGATCCRVEQASGASRAMEKKDMGFPSADRAQRVWGPPPAIAFPKPCQRGSGAWHVCGGVTVTARSVVSS